MLKIWHFLSGPRKCNTTAMQEFFLVFLMLL